MYAPSRSLNTEPLTCQKVIPRHPNYVSNGQGNGYGYSNGYGYVNGNGNGNGNGYHAPSAAALDLGIDDAEHARRRKEYAVYPIIPRREITLIGGSPHVGTTTLLMMMCNNYQNGKTVLGHTAYSSPGSATLLCHSHSKGVIQRIASRLGIVSSEMNLVVMGIRAEDRDRDKNTFAQIVRRLRKQNKNLDIIFLDGYHRLFRGK